MRVCLLLIIIISNTFVMAMDCREVIVNTHEFIRSPIEEDSFSTNDFFDFNISIEEFNNLDPAEQLVIYNKIKPIENMVDETIAKVNHLRGYFVQQIEVALENIRANRDEIEYYFKILGELEKLERNLKDCNKSET